MQQYKFIILFLFLSLSAFGAGTYIKGPGLIEGFIVVISGGGTTTLTKDSETRQVLVGSSAQTFKLPDATTLPLGRKFYIMNKSSGTATVNDYAGALVATVLSGQQKEVFLRVGTTADGTWDATRILVDLSNDATGTLGISNGGTGSTTLTANAVLLGNGTSALQAVSGSVSGDVLSYNGSTWISRAISTGGGGGGSGNVTGVASSVSGEATIFNDTTGKSIGRATGTGFAKLTSGVLSAQTSVSLTSDVTGTLPIANGGTGQTSAQAAIDALLPTQTSNSGKYLTTNGTTSSWGTVSAGSSGDVTGPSSSVSGEVTVYNDTTGKKVARASGTGFAKLTSGVLSTQASVSMTSDVTGTLPIANGGTGLTSIAAPSALVAETANAISAASGATANKVLRTDGSTISFAAVNVSTDTTGVLNVANGGTGKATLTANALLLGNGTNPVGFLSGVTSGDVTTWDGSRWTSQAATGGGGGGSVAVWLDWSGTQSISHSALTKLTFSSASFTTLTGFTHSAGTFTNTTSGNYLVSCEWERGYVSDNAVGRHQFVAIYKNGSEVIRSGMGLNRANNAVESQNTGVQVQKLIAFSTVGPDTFECYAFQSNDNGTAYNAVKAVVNAIKY